jgi:uncharacterized protein (TIGR02118 family)
MPSMIRLVYLLRRKPELSLEEFHRYWRDEHGPLVAFHQVGLGIVRYTQSHRVEDPANDSMAAARGGMEPPYDGVAELWWESEGALAAASATERGRRGGAELLTDEARFIDLPASPLWLAHEYPQVNPVPETVVARPKSPVVKLHFPLRHPPGMTLEAAQTYWRTMHGPLIRSMAAGMGMLRYQQVHRYASPLEAVLRDARGTAVEAYTGHAEAWVDRAVRRGGPEAAAAGRAAVEDEARFIDFGRSAIWFGKEHVFIDRY